MTPLRLVDLHFGGREHSVGVYLLETPDGLALQDCGPASTLPRLDSGPPRARRRADRSPPSAPLAHPPRPRRRGRLDRSAAPELHGLGLRSRGSPPDRPLPPRAVRAAALRRDVRSAVGRAAAGAEAERADRRRRRARLGGISDRRPRLPSRVVLPRRHVARRRRVRGPDRTVVVCASRSPLPPTSTSRRGTRPIAEIRRREPERLALVHFGVHTDPAAHLDRLEAELDRWAARVRSGMDADEFVAAARADVAAEADDVRPSRAVRPVLVRATPLLGQAARGGSV